MGPTLPISQEIGELKYYQKGEDFREAMSRVAYALGDTQTHSNEFRDLLLEQKFMPAGRVLAAMGANKNVTPYNCFVSGTIKDSMKGIMDAASNSAMTMRMGGGIGYDFSTLRPAGDNIRSLNSSSSGAVSFMSIFDAVCGTISSSGHRRGAQMGVLRVDHPDIEEFIAAKHNSTNLTNFNVSIGITDEFMLAVQNDRDFDLTFEGRVYKTVNAKNLWESVMRSTWDWAEPGVLFLDTINAKNNLWKQEYIAATNPCAEQPLPPNGACLLGSLNITKYVHTVSDGLYNIDVYGIHKDVPVIIRAMDNVVDKAVYPLPEQEAEAKAKRRMGIGVTGMANAIEACGFKYGSSTYVKVQSEILGAIRNAAYQASADLAVEKGPYPAWDSHEWAGSDMSQALPPALSAEIYESGLRNSHLLSIAPTGTISLWADNVSSGIEPTFARQFERTIQMSPTVSRKEIVEDYGVRVFGNKPKTAHQCSINDHLHVLIAAQKYVDSAVSKTVNVGDDVTFEEFKGIYMAAWEHGCKGCTTFREAGKRYGVLNVTEESEGAACFIDPETGSKTCD